MTAAIESRTTLRRDSQQFNYPVAANTKVLAGVMVSITTAGYLVNGRATATDKCVGVCDTETDNTGGVDGALKAPVRRSTFKFFNSASTDQITLADVGSNCYVVDNQTVAKTSNSNARPVAGIVRDVEADGVWVQF